MRFNKLRIFCALIMYFLGTGMVNAQLGKEAWHWQFGDSCALDFSSGIPVAGKSSISTNEGSASISDPNTGQLLFYTDGTNVWDKNNNQMPNGFGMIGGNGTSTQAALIVPKPGSSTIYYLFSADQGGYYNYPNNIANQGVHYSLVDMSLNGGLGDVTTKNVSLTPPPTTEKLTAIKHCNGVDYWIITHPFNSNAFNVYKLNSTGLNLNSITSNVGTVQTNISGKYAETIGYLKASPNGKKIALAVSNNMNFVELFDFDNSTGIVSNPIKISYSSYVLIGPYGISFSPDNTKLYTGLVTEGIFQYDLTSNNPTSIIASQSNIFSLSNPRNYGYLSALQLGPDGKIYISFYDSTNLAVINNPNKLGAACNFTLNGPKMQLGTLVQSGLPNFIEANKLYSSNTHYVSLCNFSNYTIFARGNNNFIWNNGDTTKSINIANYGTYWVSSLDSSGCRDTDTFYVIKISPPLINILKDTSQCTNTISNITINATDTGVINYNWNDGTLNPTKVLNDTGVYWIDYTFTNFCVSRDSFLYKINPIPIINLGKDTAFCFGSLPLTAYNANCNYLWSGGETSSSIIAIKPDIYWVKVTSQYGCITSDTILVKPDTYLLSFIMPNIVTPNNDGINDFIDFSKYEFSTMQLFIFDRWGKTVFESNNPNTIWKPTENDGTYFYAMQFSIDCGIFSESKTVKGFITILK